ncbi:acetylcholine receptor subunit beta-like [Clavelina lepadiformis]|uniref:Uncharacterized protein n=1 Tax=Clavelina lepadiformis TaxID=159417 RepID=A0ABP0H1K3_CLALP
MKELRRPFGFLVWFLFLQFVESEFWSSESKLADKLLKTHNPQMRPFNLDNRTLVKVAMTLSQIISVKEKSQELTTSVYMTYEWLDESFSWDPPMYENIKILRLPSYAVWTPRIILQNSKDGSFDVSLMTNVLIYNDGKVEWIPPALYKSSCIIEVALFPFDWQNCSMVFRSATYDRADMELGLAYGEEIYVDENAFQPNGEWDLIQRPAKINHSPDDPLYQDVTFYFVIKRRPQFYVMNLLVPCILMSSLSCFVFYLPSISCEKMTLSISILLGETVFLFLIAQRMPETSLAVPLIAGYLLFCMTLVIISVVCSVVVCNVHYRSSATHIMPKWIEWLYMEKLAPILNVERPSEEPANPVRRPSSIILQNTIYKRSWKSPSSVLYDQQADKFGLRARRLATPASLQEVNGDKRLEENVFVCPNVKGIPYHLKPALNAVNYIAKHKKMQDRLSQSQDDWAYVALILDRLLLWVYFSTFTVGTLAFFLQTTTADYPLPNSTES